MGRAEEAEERAEKEKAERRKAEERAEEAEVTAKEANEKAAKEKADRRWWYGRVVEARRTADEEVQRRWKAQVEETKAWGGSGGCPGRRHHRRLKGSGACISGRSSHLVGLLHQQPKFTPG